MKNIATMTVIKASGEGSDVLVNGIVNQEIKRIQAENNALTEQIRAIQQREARLLEERLARFNAQMPKERKIFRRLRSKIEIAWTMLWWTGLALGLWEVCEEDDDGA